MPRPPMAIRPSSVRWAYVYPWALSPIVSRPSQPISFQAAALSGSVTIIELFMGSSVRRCPGSRAVKPSVARSTNRAVTSPNTVHARGPGPAFPARQDPGHRGGLVDLHPAALDPVGQPGDQLGRLNPGAVR